MKTTHPTVLLLLLFCIRCRGNVFIELLPCNDRNDTHTDTQTDGRDL
jgi:hypothetical protein